MRGSFTSISVQILDLGLLSECGGCSIPHVVLNFLPELTVEANPEYYSYLKN